MRFTHEADVVVIGAGIGGLTAGAYLAHLGRRVLVLEQHHTLGGCTQAFSRQRSWQFPVGLHYLGDCGPGGEIPRILRGIGLDERIEFLAFDRDGFDTICLPGAAVRVPVGWDRYEDSLVAAFPGDERGLRRFVRIVRRIGTSLNRRDFSPIGLARFVARAGIAARWALAPLASLLDACGLSPEARAAASAQWLTYACPPSRAPVALHAGYLQNYVGRGAFYPRGGGPALAASLADAITGAGGVTRTGARVDRILLEGGRVAGVRLVAGETVKAPVVISNADLKQTYLRLVGRSELPRRMGERIQRLRVSAPWVNVYLGVATDLRGTTPKTNYFAVPTLATPDEIPVTGGEDATARQEAWLERAATRLGAFVHSPSVVDAGTPQYAPQGCSVVEVMSTVPESEDLWGAHGETGASRYRKAEAYASFKERLTHLLVSRAEAVLPQIAGRIQWKEASTPLTHARYTLSTGGSAYGVEFNARQALVRPRARSAVPGLLFAGTNTIWGPAVEGAMISGVHAAGAVLGRDLFTEIGAGSLLGR